MTLRLALLLAAAGLAGAHPAAARSPQAAAAHEADRREHVSIVDEGGTGPAVLLIPGLSSPRAVWAGVVPALRAGHHVFTVQVNGFGGDDPGGNLKPGILDGTVAEVDAFIVAKKLRRPAVIGHSMGGLIGMMLAKGHPDHIGRLLIVDSLPYVGESFRQGVTVAQVEPQARAMRDQIAGNYGKPHNPAAVEALANSLAATPDARAQVKAWMQEADPRVSGQAMYEDMTTDLRPDVAGFALPITLVYPAQGDELYHAVFGKAPRVTYVPVAGAGHFVMLDKPAEFAKAVDAFLK